MNLAGFFFYKRIVNSVKEKRMFRIIGATVVYGFATYGLFTWLQKFKKDEEKQVGAQQN
jgi:hypothetical protein